MPTCQRACVPAWITCQRANFSFLRANVPYGVPMFHIGVATCQKACHVFKHSSREMLREVSIFYYLKKKILHYT